MILNERQYCITKSEIKKFQNRLDQLNNIPPPVDENEKIKHQIYIDANNHLLEVMRKEVEEYEKLKEGNISSLQPYSFEKLPEMLIKARIIRGLTQEQLAERLNVKPQQIQRDEANKYASASFTKILKVQQALDLKVIVVGDSFSTLH